MPNRVRIGVDVGGTFTDLVLADEDEGLVFTDKLLTTPDDPGRAIVEGLKRLLSQSGRAPDIVHSVVHGTTLVTNTIIEQTGATVGLITTRGFRDALEMGREIRYDLYDLFLEATPTLVPRHRRLGVPGRFAPDGEELEPFDADRFRAAVSELLESGIDALAVSFVHSYRHHAHEQRAGDILREEFPELPFTLSHRVAPEIREFERTSTACANAYVQPMMRGYLGRFEQSLSEIGFRARLYVMLSGGGIATLEQAVIEPIQLIESGPAAGAMVASHYGRLLGKTDLISFDMGGTTAKMCLIEGGRPEPLAKRRTRPASNSRVRTTAKMCLIEGGRA
ncbi:MAG: hydantoinase/oxoprolinase family protein, partial [Pseudomonadota bacterium]